VRHQVADTSDVLNCHKAEVCCSICLVQGHSSDSCDSKPRCKLCKELGHMGRSCRLRCKRCVMGLHLASICPKRKVWKIKGGQRQMDHLPVRDDSFSIGFRFGKVISNCKGLIWVRKDGCSPDGIPSAGVPSSTPLQENPPSSVPVSPPLPQSPPPQTPPPPPRQPALRRCS
jgi:hypothetical protein